MKASLQITLSPEVLRARWHRPMDTIAISSVGSNFFLGLTVEDAETLAQEILAEVEKAREDAARRVGPVAGS